eukprot:581618-Pyramimonas_sp.AAC.1
MYIDDNIGAGFIAQNDMNNSKTKHIDIRYHLVRDWIAKGTIALFLSRGLLGQSRRHFHQGLVWTSSSRPISSPPRWTLPFVADLKPG